MNLDLDQRLKVIAWTSKKLLFFGYSSQIDLEL